VTWNVLQSVGVLGSGSSTVATYTSNVSSGTKLIAYFSAFGSSSFTITSVKDGALNTMTQVGFLYSATSGTGTGIFAMDTPAGDVGTKPVITALMSNSQFGSMVIQEVSGLAVGNTLGAMVDGTAAATGFAAGASHAQPAYSSTAAGEFLVSFCGDQGGPQTMTKPAAYTLDANAVNNNSSADCCPAYANSANGAESGTWSYSGSTIGSNIMVVAFQLAAGGAAAVPATPAARMAPGWHPGRGLPGLPAGTPFLAAQPGAVAAAVADTGIGPGQRTMTGIRRQAPDAGTRATYT
jgi:hypothetical protein